MSGEATVKERTVAALRLKEQTARDEVARLRARYDQVASSTEVSEVIRWEAKADAFRDAAVIVEQDGAVF